MPSKIVELQFPLKGLSKDAAFQRQAPYSSPSLNNVRPSDTYVSRARGGSRPGLAKWYAAQLGSGNPVRLLSEVTYATTAVPPVTIGLASANGVFYKESSGNWASIGGSLTLASDRMLAAVPRLQKSYIADVSTTPVASGTDGVVTTTNTFDSATYSNWTTVTGLNANDYVLHLFNATDRSTIGIYPITSVAAGTLGVSGSPANATGLSFQIIRAAKIYDPATNALSIWSATAGKGFVPPNCPIICRWRDRIVLAGDFFAPHLFYCSRAGDSNDFDYSQDDAGAAYTSQGTLAGGIGDEIRALVPHGDECMLVGCKQELWIAQGDGTYGGGQVQLSSQIGIVDKQAWARTPSGWTYFLSLDGLYAMGPGCGSVPVEISRQNLPEDLLAIDNSTNTVTMAYDLRDQGVHLFVAPNSGGVAGTKHYFLTVETETGGTPTARFFPQSYPYNYEPTALFSRRESTNANSTVILGCRDGYTRNHQDAQTTDDGTTITSTVMIGPMGAPLFDSLVKDLVAILGASSGDVTWSLHVANTPEGAIVAAAHSSGTWSAGLNPSTLPRGRGAAFCLKLTGTTRWAMERIDAIVDRQGRTRL